MKMPDLIRQDADLLTRSDSWLNTQIKVLEEEHSKIGSELGVLRLVLKYKKAMYENGLVAVHEIMRDEHGEIDDMVIKLVRATTAKKCLNDNGNDTAALLCKMGQLTCWESDKVNVN